MKRVAGYTIAERRAAFWRRARQRQFPPPGKRDDLAPLAICVEAIPPGIGIEAVRVWFGEDAWGVFLDLPLANEQDPAIMRALTEALVAQLAG